jgi:hypothetical protein
MPNYPTVSRQAVDGFLKIYNQGGLVLLFDSTSRKAMKDFADVCLRSYVIDLQEQAAKLLAAKKALVEKQSAAGVPATDAIATVPVPQSAPQKSSIILTDN